MIVFKYSNNYRLIINLFLLLNAYISYFDFNIALTISLILAFITNKFGYLEYFSYSMILLVKSQSDTVLSSSDLQNYTMIYNMIGSGYYPFNFFDQGEVLLPSLFFIFSGFFDKIEYNQLSFFFVLSILVFYFPIVYSFKKIPIIAISTLIFLDINLVVHLFRQSLDSMFLLLSFYYIFIRKNNIKGTIALIMAFSTHLTSYVFFPLMYLFHRLNIRILKYILGISFFLGFIFLTKDTFFSFLASLHGLPIVGKASYALSVYDSAGTIRAIAVISAIFLLLFVKNENYDKDSLIKIYIGFISLSIIFYNIPIIAPRIGLMASSILTGLPIGIGLWIIKLKIGKIL